MLWTNASRGVVFRLVGLTLVWGPMLLGSGPAARAIDWSDNFDGAALHQPFVIYDNDGNIPPSATTTRLTNNALELIGSTVAYDTYVGATVGLGNPQYSFTDVRLRADVSVPNNLNFLGQTTLGNDDVFLAARATADGRSAYVLALDFFDGGVDLVRSDGGSLTGLADGNIVGFNPLTVYTLELTAQGTTITGKVFSGSSPLLTITANDATYAAGWSGVGGSINDNSSIGGAGGAGRTPVTAKFDNVSSVSTSTVPGDLNGDRIVNRTDVALFASLYGLPNGGVPATGDFSGDGRVGLLDLSILQSNLTPGGSPSAVPEPGTLGLLIVAAALGVARRASRRD